MVPLELFGSEERLLRQATENICPSSRDTGRRVRSTSHERGAAVRKARLIGRRAETDVLVELLDAVRSGRSQALLLRGEPGVGKTALLEHLAGQASDCRVLRAAGVQAELELPFAGLHQWLSPVLEHLELVPQPQRDALRTAFAIAAGAAPDRLHIALAVLSIPPFPSPAPRIGRPRSPTRSSAKPRSPSTGRLLVCAAARNANDRGGPGIGSRS